MHSIARQKMSIGYTIVSRGIHECIPRETMVLPSYFMTVMLRPTWTYEQRDQLVTLQWIGLWELFHSRHCVGARFWKKARKYSTVFKIRLCILCREYEKNREFSTIILIYLGDNTIYDHSYNGRPILIGTYTWYTQRCN